MDGSTPSSSVSTTSQRPRDFRVCVDDDNGNTDVANTEADLRRNPLAVAPIQFRYSIGTDFSPALLSLRQKDLILSSVSTAVIDSIYGIGCLPPGRKRRRQTAVSFSSSARSRRAEILSISPGTGHEWLGSCEDFLPSNGPPNTIGTYCSMIQGIVVISFDEKNDPDSNSTVATDFDSVGNVVLSKIEEDMINGIYIEKVNDDIMTQGVAISNMSYIDSDYPDFVAQGVFGSMNTDPAFLEAGTVPVTIAEMTLFSKVAIPIMAILFLLAMVFCWCALKSWPNNASFPKIRKRSSENEDFRGSNNYLQPNAKRDQDENDLVPSSITRYGNAGEMSLAATLQDLSRAEMLKYGDRNTTQPSSSGNNENPSTIPKWNTKSSSGTERCLPASVRSRPQNTMHVVDGTSHPSDTETGSSSHSVDFHNGMGDYLPKERKAALENGVNRARVPNDHPFVKRRERKTTPIRLLSSFLGRNNASEVSSNVTKTNNLIDRISSCTGIESNNCLGGDQELPSHGLRNQNDEKAFRYVIPTVDRSNSLVETESRTRLPPSEETPNTSVSTLSRMGTKKSAAYREYINNKMLQREAEWDKPESSVPIEIGVRRTFTDAQGQIREMVAL